MSYRGAMRQLAQETDTDVQRLYADRGPQATALIAAVIARANTRAFTLADIALAAQLSMILRRPVPPAGVTRDVERHQRDVLRLVNSVGTLLAAKPETVADLAESRVVRLSRLARAEPLAASQAGRQEAMADQQVQGWRRVTGPNACPLCREWDDGQVRPTSIRMAHHTGCSCVQEPVIR